MKRNLALFLLVLFSFSLVTSVFAASNEGVAVVYLDGTHEAGGDGLTVKTAVNTLADAYAVLCENESFVSDPDYEGKIILCGDVVQAASFLPGVEFSHKGRLTITAENGAVLYLGSEDARSYVQFRGPTCLDNLNVDLPGADSGSEVTVYAGSELHTTERFVVTHRGEPMTLADTDCYFSVRSGFRQKDVVLDRAALCLMGGVFRSVSAGSDRHPTGSVEITLGGAAKVTRFVECGSVNSQSIGDVTLNIERGQQIDLLFLYSHLKKDANAVLGDLTLNVKGCISNLHAQRNSNAGDATAVREGNITVNIYPGGMVSGLGSDYTLQTAACRTEGERILNVFDYDGSVLREFEKYSVVNLYAQSAPDAGVDPGAAGVNIYGFTGEMVLPSDTVAALRLFDHADVTCVSAVPSNLPIEVEEGSILRLLSARNANVPEKALGEVVLETIPSTAVAPVLEVNFEGKNAADISGYGNDGVVSGSPVYTEGYNGETAVALRNRFGTAAQNYISFADLQGVDLRVDDYTVLLQYQAVCGGTYSWVGSSKASLPGTSVTEALAGGVLFANCGAADASGVLLEQLPLYCYLTAQTGDDVLGGAYQIQDGRWHQLALVVDRERACSIYVDDVLVGSIDLTDRMGEFLGENTLVLGADLLGQYGLGNACIDDLRIYPQALSYTDICYHHVRTALERLTLQVEGHLGYASEGAEALAEANETAKAAAEAAKAEELFAIYDALDQNYQAYLSTGTEEADFALALLSDVHVTTVGDAFDENLATVLRDLDAGPSLDGIVISGDFANDSTAHAVHSAFTALNALLEDGPQYQAIVAYGNHEVRYISEEECFNAGAAQFWEDVQAHISDDAAVRRFGSGALDSTCNYSYGMTLDGYHFLVLNTDNPGQSGNVAETGDPASDPIRRGMYFESRTLLWLEQMLTMYERDGLPIFVVGHFPFDGSVPFANYSDLPLEDSSVGKQDGQVRKILGQHANVVYICGHLHSGLGVSGPVTVTDGAGGSFIQINLPSLKASPRGYMGALASWYLFAYEDRIVLRARDFSNGLWLTEYDAVIPLEEAQVCDGGDACPSAHFTDAAGWYHEVVDSAVRMGCIAGMTATTFGPNVSLNRAMLVTILYRSAGEPETNVACSFADVKPTDYYYNAVCWAQENSIVFGITDTEFGPKQTATREMIAAILHRMAGSPACGSEVEFTDAAQISGYAREAVAWAVSEGLFHGYPDQTLRPKRSITRAELVTLVINGLQIFV